MNPETIKQVKDAQKALLQATEPAKARKPITREEWLNHAAEVIRKAVAKRGITVPPVKISCSWPGGGSPVKRIGECWSTEASKARINEIFISPKLADSRKVICVLAHELAHAVDNCKHAHKKEFVRIGQEMGLEGKPTQMEPRPEFADAWTAIVVGKWGEFPHSELDKSKAPVKKQSTRLIKCACLDCDAIWRMTQSVIDCISEDDGMSCPVCHGENVGWGEEGREGPGKCAPPPRKGRPRGPAPVADEDHEARAPLPTALYRCFNDSDRLLYVGFSANPPQRLEQHRDQPWYADLARVEVEWFDNRRLAEAAEATAIRKEKPRYNYTNKGA